MCINLKVSSGGVKFRAFSIIVDIVKRAFFVVRSTWLINPRNEAVSRWRIFLFFSFLFHSEQDIVYICIVYVRIVTQLFVIYAYRLECMVPQTPSASFTSAVRVKFRISSNNTNDQNRLDRLPREIMRTTVV